MSFNTDLSLRFLFLLGACGTGLGGLGFFGSSCGTLFFAGGGEGDSEICELRPVVNFKTRQQNNMEE